MLAQENHLSQQAMENFEVGLCLAEPPIVVVLIGPACLCLSVCFCVYLRVSLFVKCVAFGIPNGHRKHWSFKSVFLQPEVIDHAYHLARPFLSRVSRKDMKS